MARPIFHRSYALVAALLIILMSIAACNIPTEYQAELGKKISIQLDQMPVEAELRAAISHITSFPDVDDANVNVRMTPDGGLIDVALWGGDFDVQFLISDLQSHFPGFADARITVEALNKTVEAPLYERFCHDVFGMEFDIVVEGQTVEEIRQQVLAQLYAGGYEGEAEVEVQMTDEEGGMQRVEIKIQAEDCPEDDSDGEQ